MILLVVSIIYAGKYAIKEKEEIPDEYKQTDISYYQIFGIQQVPVL